MSKQMGAAAGGAKNSILSRAAKHPETVSTVLLTQVGARLLALAAFLAPRRLLGGLPWWVGCILALAVVIGVVMPVRCQGGEKLRRMFYTRGHGGDRKGPYRRWLQTGALRLGRGLLWGIPFFAVIGLTVYAGYELMYSPNGTAYLKQVRQMAAWIGREADTVTGLLVALGLAAILLVLTGILFAYGWRRDLLTDYLPARSMGAKRTVRWANHLRRHHSKECAAVTRGNLLLCLPAVIGFGAVLARYGQLLMNYLKASGLDVSAGAMQLRSVFSQLPLPSRNQALFLAGVVVLVYLPTCMIRKIRNARLTGQLMQGGGEHHHHHHTDENAEGAEQHAAG